MMLFGVRFGKQHPFPSPVFISKMLRDCGHFKIAENKSSAVFLVTGASLL